jgi:anti-sigma B factor antagonist
VDQNRIHRPRTPATVAAAGELDLNSVPFLRQAIDRAIEAAPGTLVLDLTAITFSSSCGLSELIRAKDRTDATGIRLTIAPSDFLARILTVTGLDGFLHTAPAPAPLDRR